MNSATKIILTVSISGLLIGLTAFKLMDNKSDLESKVYHPDVNTEVSVQTEIVKAHAFSQHSTFTGTFVPNREVTLGAETTGKVIRVNIEEGKYVQAGQLLAQLDDGLVRAQLQSAEASFNRAENTLNRYLQASSGVTQLQIDNAKTDVLTARAQVEQLKKQVRQYAVLAPFSGIISSKKFDLGAIVSPGLQMASLIDISTVKLEINVPENEITDFTPGQLIDVRTDVYPGKVFKGKVEMIASDADDSHNFLIRIVVSNHQSALKSGMYGMVDAFDELSASALTIPRAALVGSAQNAQVYVVENGVARLRQIRLGAGNETRVEVTEGLIEGEVIVIGGLVNIRDGVKVNRTK